MPIYEFYCRACHTLLNFFSPTVDTERRPDCPLCGAGRLERRPARFSTPGAATEHSEALPEDRMEALLERAAEAMTPEFGTAGESDDPRQMARLMRRFSSTAGLELSDRMESLVSRLEAGEDSDAVERDLGALDDQEGMEGFFRLARNRGGGDSGPPRRDDELYFF